MKDGGERGKNALNLKMSTCEAMTVGACGSLSTLICCSLSLIITTPHHFITLFKLNTRRPTRLDTLTPWIFIGTPAILRHIVRHATTYFDQFNRHCRRWQ